MIRFVTPELEPVLDHFCNTDSVFHAKIYSQYKTYGTQSGIVDFWLIFHAKQPVGAISGSSGRFTFAADACEDVQELAAFLSAAGAKNVQGERRLLDDVGSLQESGQILSAQECPKRDNEVQPPASLDDVWKLMCAAYDEFEHTVSYDGWYTEFSHKLRHDLAQCFALYVEGKLVSATSVLFKNTKCAVLAAVATHPDARGQGFGRRTVIEATASAIAQGLTPKVLIREPELQRFYAACGYRVVGEWGQAEVQRDS